MPEDLIDAEAVAKKLGVKRNSVYQMVKRNKIPCVRLPGMDSVRFEPSAIDRYIEQGRQQQVNA